MSYYRPIEGRRVVGFRVAVPGQRGYGGNDAPEAVRLLRAAETNVDAASAAVDEPMQQARKALESTASAESHVWHRNWIVSRKERWEPASGIGKVVSPNSWFDHAWRRYQQEQRRVEHRAFDAIETLQHVVRQRVRGGEQVAIEPTSASSAEPDGRHGVHRAIGAVQLAGELTAMGESRTPSR